MSAARRQDPQGPAWTGRVVRLDARGCLVRLDEAHDELPGAGNELWCAVRGRHYRGARPGQKTPAVVGDRVVVHWSGEDRGAIDHLEPRRTTLSRPSTRRERVEHVMAANADRVAIVSAAADPIFNPALVDRILAVVEFSHLDAIVVVNKLDLVDEEPEELDVYRELGYAVVATSVVDGRGIEALRDELAGRVTVVTGHSGVGKSSLLNAVQGGLGLAVGDVNEVTGRGTHTTTASTWVDLDVGGAVIDTAGIREFGLFGIPKREVPWLFRDIAKIAPECRYPDCSHTHEPGCAVLIAVEDGRLADFRFDSYLKLLESLDEAPQ